MIKKVVQDKFIRRTGLFMAGSLGVAFLNYLYYPVMGRFLGPADFGDLQALFSIYLQFSVLVYIFSFFIIQIVANEKDEARARERVGAIAGSANRLMFATVLLIVLFSGQIGSYLNLSSFLLVLMLAPVLWLAVRFSIYCAVWQGRQELNRFNVAYAIVAIGRLAFGAVLAALGYFAFGAMAGLFVAQLAALYFAGHGLDCAYGGTLFGRQRLELSRSELYYALAVFAGVSAITFFYSADVIFAKHYFDAHTAGLYSGISTVARILYFMAGPIAGALLPAVKHDNEPVENRKLLVKAIYLILATNSAIFLTFYFFSVNIIEFLLGSEYIALAHLLPSLSLLMFLVAILNVIFFYQLALKRFAVFYIAISGVALTLLLNFIRHTSLQEVIFNFYVGVALCLALGLIQYAKNHFHPDSGFQRGA